jgi:GntR family transcriptional regulator/MocR family aminotransferase
VLRARAVWESIPLSRTFAEPAQFDFRVGIPDESMFPHAAWRRLVMRELRAEAAGRNGYGHPAGHLGLREAIARHLSTARGMATSADDTTVTSGTQQALDIIARVLLRPGERIAVEDPGYVPSRLLFRSLGAQVSGVPVDDQGIIVDAIPRHTRVVYVTPSHQYPLGVPMALSRRQALLAWAEKNDAAIIEDDYDSEFRFGGRPIEPLRLLDASGRVVYVGSFSKTMLPALRLGFVVTPPSLRDAMHRAKYVTDWHTSTLVQAALARFIDDGAFARHVRKMGNVYRTRREIILKTLARDFAGHLDVIPSVAGLHVSATARAANAERICDVVRRAGGAGVALQDLSARAMSEMVRPGLTLGYGAIPTTSIAEGLRTLRKCFDD